MFGFFTEIRLATENFKERNLIPRIYEWQKILGNGTESCPATH